MRHEVNNLESSVVVQELEFAINRCNRDVRNLKALYTDYDKLLMVVVSLELISCMNLNNIQRLFAITFQYSSPLIPLRYCVEGHYLTDRHSYLVV